MPDIQFLTKTRLTGEITRIRFKNEDTGFCVAEVLSDDERRLTICGVMPGCAEGQCFEADGNFEKHETFGTRFKVDTIRIVPPSTVAGIERFLRFQVTGIGPKTAAAIVKHFGKETIRILDLYPGRLCEVPKIGKQKAQTIAKVWKNSRSHREDMIFLQGLGLTPAYCQRLLKCYGERTVEIVRANPYRLAEDINGIGFLKADNVARELGFAADSIERMTAAAVFTINNMISEGHVCSPIDELIARSAELTGLPPSVARRGVESAIEKRLIFLEENFCYTPYLLHAETRLPRLKNLPVSALPKSPPGAIWCWTKNSIRRSRRYSAIRSPSSPAVPVWVKRLLSEKSSGGPKRQKSNWRWRLRPGGRQNGWAKVPGSKPKRFTGCWSLILPPGNSTTTAAIL